MKKLALVIALAVAASWMIHDRRGRDPSSPLADRLRDADRTIRHDLEKVKHDLAKGKHGPRRGRTAPPVRGADDVVLVDDLPAVATPLSTTTPAWFPATARDEEDAARPGPTGSRVLVGRLSASEDRARRDLDEKQLREVREWLAADVSPTWTPPARDLAAMRIDVYVQPVAQVFKPLPGEAEAAAEVPIATTFGEMYTEDGRVRHAPTSEVATPSVLDDVYTLYHAGGRFDFSADRKARLVATYRRQVVDHRLHKLGGGLVLALVGLAALVGYVRADEATKGFYTNRIRLATAAGVGAAGYAIYRAMMS